MKPKAGRELVGGAGDNEAIGALRISSTTAGLQLDVQVQPRASRNAIVGVFGDRMKVALTAPPVDGAANEALVATLAKTFEVPRSAVQIVRGLTGRKKTVVITGTSVAKLQQVLVHLK